MAFYRMSGSSKGELHGASVLVSVPDATAGETVTLEMGSTYSKSGVLSDALTCLFSDILDEGTYTATYQTFTSDVEITASDILNKNTVPVTISQNLTITFTVEGAKEDSITITHPSLSESIPVDFNTGQTSEEVTIVIPPELEGTDFTFTSSVAKDTTTGTSDYSITVPITTSTTNVKVMPEGALYWYGNECVDVTNGWILVTQSDLPSDVLLINSTLERNTNNMTIKNTENLTNAWRGYGIKSNKNIDYSKYSEIAITATLNMNNAASFYEMLWGNYGFGKDTFFSDTKQIETGEFSILLEGASGYGRLAFYTQIINQNQSLSELKFDRIFLK